MANRTIIVAPSGGDYTTLSAAIDAQEAANGDLTSDNGSGGPGILYFKIQGDWSAGADTTQVNIDAFTTDANNYVHIYTDSANRAKLSAWDETRYRLVVTDDAGSFLGALCLRSNHTVVDGLQIKEVRSSGSGIACVYVASIDAANKLVVKNCRIIHDASTSADGYGIRINDSQTIMDIFNCIIYQCDLNGIFVDAAATTNIYNNTIYDCNSNGIEVDAGTCTIKNNVLFSNVDDIQDDSGTATIDYNAADDADGTNRQALNENASGEWTAAFSDYTTGDFRAKAGGLLIDHGMDGSAVVTSSQDMDANSRGATWDIGASEYIAAATGSIIPQVMAYYRRLRN